MRRERAVLRERMTARGIRMTGPRRLIAEVLEGAEHHLDADAIFRLARRRDPGIHRSTVYRTLSRLTRLGLLDQLDLMHRDGDRHFYEVRPSSFHIHLVCMQCGAVDEPGGPFWDQIKGRVFEESGFRAHAARLEMGGTCRNCAEQQVLHEE